MRAWEEFIKFQEGELGLEVVNKWLKPLRVLRFDACNLYLEAPDSFKSLWFEEHMRRRVESRFVNNNNKKIRVHLSVAQHPKDENHKKKAKSSPSITDFKLSEDSISEEASFQNFRCLNSNRLGYRILCDGCSVDEKSALPIQDRSTSVSFNPIYLCGPEGTGKTHLMMAAAHAYKTRGMRALYCRCETFTEHVVQAIRLGDMHKFRKFYRGADVLLIDSVDVLSKKTATQEEFFHTFNALHVEGKQIILSSRLAPQDLTYIEPRLVSRFEWGVVVPLNHPEKEEMLTILKERALNIGFNLTDEIFLFLIETFSNNLKSLLRSLEALALRTHLNLGASVSSVTLAQAQKYLADLIQKEQQALLTPSSIIQTVADYFGITMQDILSKSQARECVLPRQIAMHFCRNALNLPFMKIGDLFTRDHSTVMSSVKQVQHGIDQKDSEIAQCVRGIEKILTR